MKCLASGSQMRDLTQWPSVVTWTSRPLPTGRFGSWLIRTLPLAAHSWSALADHSGSTISWSPSMVPSVALPQIRRSGVPSTGLISAVSSVRDLSIGKLK